MAANVIWNPVEKTPPPEGVPVRTMSPGGMEQVLKRKGKLWFYPDMSMYVYYTPAYWLPLTVQTATA